MSSRWSTKKKLLVGLLIPAGAVITAAVITGMLGRFKSNTSASISNAALGTNWNRVVAVGGNQNGNNSIDDHSTTMPQTFSVGQNQAPLYAPQTTTINNYYGVVSNSVTKDAFDALENALSTATNKIELTAKEVYLLAQALRDLDQRTSDIEKLPDGRTKFGGIVSGEPKVIIEAFNLGFKHYTNKEYSAALPYFMKAINVVESEPVFTNLTIGGGDITPRGKSQFYSLASDSAFNLKSNLMAFDFAEKAVNADNKSARSYIALASASFAIARQNALANDWASAFPFVQKATEAYESSKHQHDFQITNVNLKTVEWNYGFAAEAAIRLGSNELAYSFATNLVEMNPQEIKHQIVFAVTLANTGRKDEAISVINRAFGSDSNNQVAIQIKKAISAESQ